MNAHFQYTFHECLWPGEKELYQGDEHVRVESEKSLCIKAIIAICESLPCDYCLVIVDKDKVRQMSFVYDFNEKEFVKYSPGYSPVWSVPEVEL